MKRHRVGPMVSVRSLFLVGLRGRLDARRGVPAEGARQLAPVPGELLASRNSDVAVCGRRREVRFEVIDAGVARYAEAVRAVAARIARAAARTRETEKALAEVRPAYGRGPRLLWFAAWMIVLAVAEYPLNRWSFARSPIADWLVDLMVLGFGVVMIGGAEIVGLVLTRLVRARPAHDAGIRPAVVRTTLWAFLGLLLAALSGTVVAFGLIRINEFGHSGPLAGSVGVPAVASGVALMFIQAITLAVAAYLSLSFHAAAEQRRLARELRRNRKEESAAMEEAEAAATARADLVARRNAVSEQFEHEAAAIADHYVRLYRRWAVPVVRRTPERQDEVARYLAEFATRTPTPTPTPTHVVSDNGTPPVAPKSKGAQHS